MKRQDHVLSVMLLARKLLCNSSILSIGMAIDSATSKYSKTTQVERPKRIARIIKREVSLAATGDRKNFSICDSTDHTLEEKLLLLDKATDACRAERDRLDEMDGFRRDPEFKRFMSEAERLHKEHPELQKGMCMTMSLNAVRPDIANKITLSPVDPSESDSRIPAFIEEVMLLWEDLESLRPAV